MPSFSSCPNPSCSWYRDSPDRAWFSRFGRYHTLLYGDIPRFRCHACGRTFSERTFSPEYYLKRIGRLEDVFRHCCEGMSNRAVARTLGLSPHAVQNRIERLARQSIALHQSLRHHANPHEDVAIDGFVSFDRSQYFPSEITLSITARSRFILELAHASRRRSGTMTEVQKQKASELYAHARFEPDAIRRSFREILDALARERPASRHHPLVLITDEKPDYRTELYRHHLFKKQDEDHRVAHLRVNAHLPRTVNNPLFPSNYLDRELRKDQANHRRETSCFTRCVSCGLARMMCYVAYHNYWKRFRIKAPVQDVRVHAEAAGISASILDSARTAFFTERSFLSKQALSVPLERIWRMSTPTPGVGTGRSMPLFALD